jgi:probable F420-dependent oxidoreductase
MTFDIGRFGIWKRAADVTAGLASTVEEIGYGALWIGGSPSGDLAIVEEALAATETISIATGIVNMWREDAGTVAESFHRIEKRHPGRFLLGVGIGHPESTSEYRNPYDTMVEYLARLHEADVPADHLVLAALGPKALRLSAERTAGSHPYFTTPRHTRIAREIVGAGVLLAPEQTVVVDGDADRARDTAGRFAARYLGLVNYRNSLLREGWDQADLDAGGSDRLIDGVVLTGSVDQLAAGITAHMEAGADHVCIQDLGPDPESGYRALAEVLL